MCNYVWWQVLTRLMWLSFHGTADPWTLRSELCRSTYTQESRLFKGQMCFPPEVVNPGVPRANLSFMSIFAYSGGRRLTPSCSRVNCTYRYQIIMLYTWNEHNVVCHVYLKQTNRQKDWHLTERVLNLSSYTY